LGAARRFTPRTETELAPMRRAFPVPGFPSKHSHQEQIVQILFNLNYFKFYEIYPKY
jgi:hypothetical protein